MKRIPISIKANQDIVIVLNGQNCEIILRTMSNKLYLSLYLDGIAIDTNRICHNNTFCVSNYLGFDGNLIFLDSHGTSDPEYTGLGERYNLFYVSNSDIANA